MTLRKAQKELSRLSAYIQDLRITICKNNSGLDRDSLIKKYYELCNLYTAVHLTLDEQLSKVKILSIKDEGLSMQRDIALEFDKKTYDALVKEIVNVEDTMDDLLITTKFEIDDELLSKLCSYYN